MIKLVIFDLSDVCYTGEDGPFLEQFAARHNLDVEELTSMYDKLTPLGETDEISGKDIWKRILDHYDIEDGPERIIRELMSFKSEKKDTLALVKGLRKSVKVAFLTNYNKDFWKEIERQFDPKQHFDDGIVSYQIGTRKPDVKGFKVLMDRFAVSSEETVFTDDKAKNLVQAKELGIHTVQFQSREQFEEELRKLDV